MSNAKMAVWQAVNLIMDQTGLDRLKAAELLCDLLDIIYEQEIQPQQGGIFKC